MTGANGPFGRLVAEHLLTLVPAEGVAVSVRDAAGAEALRERGVDVREADFGRPESLAGAFAGAETVFVNGTYAGAAPDVRGPQLRAAVAAARAAGARRIVVTSWQDCDRNPVPTLTDFADTEAAVRAQPLPWTLVRVGYGLATTLARDVVAARRDGVLTAPAGDARAAVGATPDQAEAAARILAADGAHDGARYDLTGPDTVGWAELAELAGPGIEYRPESEADFRARWVAKGFPEAAADQLLALYTGFRAGWAGTVTGDLAALLGRAPTPAREAVRQAVDAWAWG
ncbi:NAD(P)H-binding protein [Dactylosporangium sp. CA-092794]|uniref:NAD(P)H-binding protein n=1 Tax=Dactylosporangium sp. CA-092794 TaxID=3239929 RepID=UPI003D9015CF